MTTKQKPENEEDDELTAGIPARLYRNDHDKLKQLEAAGLNMSSVIRRCVNTALPGVVAEIAAELARTAKKP